MKWCERPETRQLAKIKNLKYRFAPVYIVGGIICKKNIRKAIITYTLIMFKINSFTSICTINIVIRSK